MKDINKFVNNLKSFCSKETCYPTESSKWTSDNPFLGHCAIISLFVFEKYGGKICRGKIENSNLTHYWNEIDGIQYDFTKEQFQNPTKISFIDYRTKDEMLATNEFKQRYENFKSKLKKSL